MILIDMDMPERCADCPFVAANVLGDTVTLFCRIRNDNQIHDSDLLCTADRPNWCPLLEYPSITKSEGVRKVIDYIAAEPTSTSTGSYWAR